MTPLAIKNFFSRLQKNNPRPATELRYGNHYQLLVAVVLSAQATDKSVNTATRPLFATVSSPAQMLKMGETKIAAAIRTIGLYRTKAKNIIALSAILQKEHGGQVPTTRAQLQALPGVGRKTANVILNTAFGENTIAVDTHIFRVANRTALAPGKNVGEVEKKLNAVVPQKYKINAHHWLILHGRYVCRARKPLCEKCAVFRWCGFADKKIIAKNATV